MGGHGALVLGLRNPERYRSISAFSPIAHPSAVPWGHKAFGGYLGADRAAWKQYDATELVRSQNLNRCDQAGAFVITLKRQTRLSWCAFLQTLNRRDKAGTCLNPVHNGHASPHAVGLRCSMLDCLQRSFIHGTCTRLRGCLACARLQQADLH